MVHDRRIDGETHVFGNAGRLFMRAMTWYDHRTESIWSQPWGRAIEGELIGTELFLLPSQLTTWGSWRAEHPNTLAMTNGLSRFRFGGPGFNENFVIGLALGDAARAYYYSDVAATTVVNDQVGETPVLLWAGDDNFHAYAREVAGETLTFREENGRIIDEQTNSTWDVSRGLATAGPLQGQALQPLPTLSSFDWAWQDFYPDGDFYTP